MGDVIPESEKLVFHGIGSAVKGAMMQLFTDLNRMGVVCPQIRDVATNSLEKYKVLKKPSADNDASNSPPAPVNVTESKEYKDMKDEYDKKIEKSKDDYNKLRETSKQKVKNKNEEIEKLKKNVEEKNNMSIKLKEEIVVLQKEKEDLASEHSGKISQVLGQNATFLKENEELKKKLEDLEKTTQLEKTAEGTASSAVIRIKSEIPGQTSIVNVPTSKKCKDCVELKDAYKNLKQLEPKYNAKKEIIKLRDKEINLLRNEVKHLNDELKQMRIELCRKKSAEDGIVMLN